MEIDTERVDLAVLALLLLGLHDGRRVWKGFDWDAMERLHKKGLHLRSRGEGEIGRTDRGGTARGRATFCRNVCTQPMMQDGGIDARRGSAWS